VVQSPVGRFSPHLKRESPNLSPISITSGRAAKRQKYSDPPTPYSNPPSAHPSVSSSSTATFNSTSASTSVSHDFLLPITKIEFLNDDQKLQLSLFEAKPKEKLNWEEIVERYYEASGKKVTEACLQMRRTRLLASLRSWTEVEV
jgi:hypothetical protein